MDEGFCDRLNSDYFSYYRPSMVAYTALPYRMDEPQHTLYCVGYSDAAALLGMVTMVRQDPERL